MGMRGNKMFFDLMEIFQKKSAKKLNYFEDQEDQMVFINEGKILINLEMDKLLKIRDNESI